MMVLFFLSNIYRFKYNLKMYIKQICNVHSSIAMEVGVQNFPKASFFIDIERINLTNVL